LFIEWHLSGIRLAFSAFWRKKTTFADVSIASFSLFPFSALLQMFLFILRLISEEPAKWQSYHFVSMA